MYSGGEVTRAAYQEAARRVVAAASEEFETSPGRELNRAAFNAAMETLQKSGNIDASSMRMALDAVRDEFVEAGFDQKGFAKMTDAKEFGRVNRFNPDAAAYTKSMHEKSGAAIVNAAKWLMGQTADVAGPELAAIIKKNYPA